MFKISKRSRDTLQRFFDNYSTVIITGGSSGIGESFIFLVGSVAKNISICNLSRKKISLSCQNNTIYDIRCDVSSQEEIDTAYDKIKTIIAEKSSSGKKILLINNAGFGAYGEFPQPSLEQNMGMIDVNIKGLTYITGKFLPEIKKYGGGIINIASTAAWQPCPYLNVYAATKSYVMSFSLGLSHELKKDNVACTCICPGPTATNFFKAAGFTDRPLPSSYGHSSNEVALASLLAFAKGKKLCVIGFLNKIMAMMSYFLSKNIITGISGWILSKIRAK